MRSIARWSVCFLALLALTDCKAMRSRFRKTHAMPTPPGNHVAQFVPSHPYRLGTSLLPTREHLEEVSGWITDQALVVRDGDGWGTLNPATGMLSHWPRTAFAQPPQLQRSPDGTLLLAFSAQAGTPQWLLRATVPNERWSVVTQLPAGNSYQQRYVQVGNQTVAWLEASNQAGAQRVVLWDVAQQQQRCVWNAPGTSAYLLGTPYAFWSASDAAIAWVSNRALVLRASDCRVLLDVALEGERLSPALSPEQETLYAINNPSSPTTIHQWNLRTGLAQSLAIPAPCRGVVRSLAVDRTEVAFATTDGVVCTWNRQTRQPRLRFNPFSTPVPTIQRLQLQENTLWIEHSLGRTGYLRSDGSALPIATIMGDASLRAQLEAVAMGVRGGLARSTYNAEHTRAAILQEHTLSLISLEQRRVVHSLSVLDDPLLTFEFSPGGRWLSSMDREHPLVLIDTEGTPRVVTARAETPHRITRGWISDRGEAVFQTEDRWVFRWARNRAPQQEVRSSSEDFYPRARVLYLQDQRVQVLTDQGEVFDRNGTRTIAAIANEHLLASKRGDFLVLTEHGRCQRIAVRTGQRSECHAPEGILWDSADIDALGQRAVTLDQRGFLVTWNLSTGLVEQRRRLPAGTLPRLFLHASGSRVWAATGTHDALAMDLPSGRFAGMLRWPEDTHMLAISPSGTYALVQTTSGVIERRTLPAGRFVDRVVLRGADGIWESPRGTLHSFGQRERALRLGTCAREWTFLPLEQCATVQ